MSRLNYNERIPIKETNGPQKTINRVGGVGGGKQDSNFLFVGKGSQVSMMMKHVADFGGDRSLSHVDAK